MDLNDIVIEPLLDTLRLEKISDQIYFSEKYSGYVSNSRLGLINPRQGGSPKQFFEGFKDTGFSPAFMLGSAVHELVLQKNQFKLSEDLGRPTAKLGAMADVLYNKFLEHPVTKEDIIEASNKIDYYKGKITSELVSKILESCRTYWENRQKQEFDLSESKEIIYLDTKSIDIVKSCVQAIEENPKMQELLHPKGIITDPISENEQAILLDVNVKCPNGKEFILRLKSKLDNYTIDTETNTIIINDLKTIGKIVSEFSKNQANFHYNREIGMYMYLLRLCAQKFYNIEQPKYQANFLVVSTIPNYYTKVVPMTPLEIRKGFEEFRVLLKYVAYNIAYKDYTLGKPKYLL